ncbi:hypothetical protein CKQ53_01235 [Lonsdalea britannica]|uniref:Uncharacterized protein n=1 Tax=Lonsdalea britannica TaxID=1082704 RepID=A0AAD0SD99_9GAMM|nr:hypothetical protein CKQ53_01235 [Lonsdalea britannica]
MHIQSIFDILNMRFRQFNIAQPIKSLIKYIFSYFIFINAPFVPPTLFFMRLDEPFIESPISLISIEIPLLTQVSAVID